LTPAAPALALQIRSALRTLRTCRGRFWLNISTCCETIRFDGTTLLRRGITERACRIRTLLLIEANVDSSAVWSIANGGIYSNSYKITSDPRWSHFRLRYAALRCPFDGSICDRRPSMCVHVNMGSFGPTIQVHSRGRCPRCAPKALFLVFLLLRRRLKFNPT
jgi:hypothetical protein